MLDWEKAHSVNMPDFVINRGMSDLVKHGNGFKCRSPFHKDQEPSFYISYYDNKWIWKDFGGDGGRGDLIDLVCLLDHVEKSEALKIILGTPITNNSFLSYGSSFCNDEDSQQIDIKSVKQLRSPALIQYAESRNVSAKIAGSYLSEAYYTVIDKETGEIKTNHKTGMPITYFALAFKNDLGGYELRSKGFKGGNKPKGITTIPGRPHLNALNVFEGCFNFLSALVYYKMDSPALKTIVLNSTSNVNQMIDSLGEYALINVYCDNDDAGRKATKLIMDRYPKTVNRSELLFPGFNDFNDFINKE